MSGMVFTSQSVSGVFQTWLHPKNLFQINRTWIAKWFAWRYMQWAELFCSVQSLRHVRLSAAPWTATHQAALPFTISWSLLKLMSIESVMLSNHLIFYHPLFLLPSIFPTIRVFSSESFLHISWPKPPGASASVLSMNIQGCLPKAGVSSHWRRYYCGLRIGGKDPWVPVPRTGSSMPGKLETMLWTTSELKMGAGT